MSVSSPCSPSSIAPPSRPRVHHHHDHRSLIALLESHSTAILHLKQIHAKLLKPSSGHDDTPLFFLYSRLVYSSSHLPSLSYACRLLLHPPLPSLTPNSFCFNSLIRAHSRASHSDTTKHRFSIQLYKQMLLSGIHPDKHTFPFVLRACASLFASSEGAQLHAHVFKLGFSPDVYVANSLVHFYSSCGALALARSVFDGMPQRNQVSWNAVIDAYATCGDHETALRLFRQMMTTTTAGLSPDVYTFQSLLRACAGLGSLSLGLWAHAFLTQNKCIGAREILGDVLINNSLIDLYSKCGALRLARHRNRL